MDQTRKTWVSKLASAFMRHSHNRIAQTDIGQEDRSIYGRLPFIDTRPPTTGRIQLGVQQPQDDCPLFNLPVEIRQTIYKHVFGPSLIHVASMERRLAHVRCEKWYLDDSWEEHTHWQCRPVAELGIVGANDRDDPNDHLSSLTLTCRRM